MVASGESLIYDWNSGPVVPDRHAALFADETLRDGLQSPSVRTPSTEEKLRILHLIESLGIQSADIGLPGAGAHVVRETERLAVEIVKCRMRVRPYCAARTFFADIKPIVEISQRVGIPLEVATFIGTSPVRQYVENWSLDVILGTAKEPSGLRFRKACRSFRDEDTTRTPPDVVRRIYSEAISWGARAIVLCDTVGHATPDGARNLVRYVREQVVGPSGETVRIDWHGHSDRGLGVINAIAAYEAGADQLHGTGLGIGERVGNVPMDLLLVNMRLMGYFSGTLSTLRDYCRVVSDSTGVPIPINYPVFGADAFRTGTGVHAAAVIKAVRKGDVELSNLVYSGVPAHWFGLEQQIEVGPMSGRSNVEYWLEKHGIEPDEETVLRVFGRAKSSDHILSESEILAAIGGA